MRHPLLVFLTAAALACGGGGGGPDDPCDVFEDAGCLDADRMTTDVRALAAPAMTGRRAGTPGNDAAVDLVEARLEALGLAPPEGAASRRRPFPLAVWIPESPPSLTLAGAAVPLGEGLEVIEFSGSGTATDAEVVFAGYGRRVPANYARDAWPDCPVDPATGYDDFDGLALEGRVVVLLRGYPAGFVDEARNVLTCPMAAGGAAAAGALGAAAVLYTSADPASTRTADFLRLPAANTTPALQLARDRLEAAIPPLSAWQAEIDAAAAPSSHATGVTASLSVAGRVEQRAPENVLAIVPGADPVLRDEVVVIGAHLDHMGQLPFRATYYPGADDNASGTAVLLELARAVSRSATAPKRTLLFAAWNAEELGLVGSFEYVEAPAYPLEDTVVAFSIDMVGDGSAGLLVYGGLESPELAATLEAGAAALGLPDWPVIPEAQVAASDHWPFVAAGVPGALFLTPRFEEHEAYHSPRDTPDVVSRETLGAAARLVWAAVRQYALGIEEAPAAFATSNTVRAAQAPAGPACFGPAPGLAERVE